MTSSFWDGYGNNQINCVPAIWDGNRNYQKAFLLFGTWTGNTGTGIPAHACNCQTVRARELKFWMKVHLPQPFMCHVSHVMCHMSCVTCHLWRVTYLFFFLSDKVVKLVGGGSVINGATLSSFTLGNLLKYSLRCFVAKVNLL